MKIRKITVLYAMFLCAVMLVGLSILVHVTAKELKKDTENLVKQIDLLEKSLTNMKPLVYQLEIISLCNSNSDGVRNILEFAHEQESHLLSSIRMFIDKNVVFTRAVGDKFNAVHAQYLIKASQMEKQLADLDAFFGGDFNLVAEHVRSGILDEQAGGFYILHRMFTDLEQTRDDIIFYEARLYFYHMIASLAKDGVFSEYYPDWRTNLIQEEKDIAGTLERIRCVQEGTLHRHR